MRAGAQTCARSYYDVYPGREARPVALGRARRRAATERAKSDTKLIAQGCNTSRKFSTHSEAVYPMMMLYRAICT